MNADNNLLQKLHNFGLNQYEAKAYAAMLTVGNANAYKISKESDIPRARIYDVLETLVKRGLAMAEESSENVRVYTPVPAKVFLDKAKGEWERDFDEVTRALSELENEASKQDIYVFTLKSQGNIISYCNRLIGEAEKYVMVCLWDKMYDMILPGLKECQKRGCRVLGIGHNILSPIQGIEAHHKGKFHGSPENFSWFILSADGKKLIYGYSPETGKDAFYTEDPSHIYLMEDYMIHDMAVNRIASDRETEEKLLSAMSDIMNGIK